MDPLPAFGPLPGPPAPPLVLDAAAGSHLLAAPTVDSDADGVPDTAVLVGGGGPGDDDTLVLATDLDADHRADVVTTVDAAGAARTVEAGADGRFAVDPISPAPPPEVWSTGPDPARDAGWPSPAPPAPSIDPATGAWTRRPG